MPSNLSAISLDKKTIGVLQQLNVY